MKTTDIERTVAIAMSVILIATSSYGFQTNSAADTPGGAADTAPMSANQLQSLVAPIALYPDPLVAQVLAAATFPDQVAVANYWVQQHHDLTGEKLTKKVNEQSWNASVKALTQFPSVLDNMAKNLNWTSSLGEAYHNQASEVMAAVQALRAKAKAAGNLKSTSQISVSQPSPQTIVIEPANPQIVYVPEYNPAVIYGTPYVVPGYTGGDVAAGALLGFGAGVAVGALASGGCCGWGWSSWNANWGGGTVVYNHNNFYGNTAWHGNYYNGAYHDGYGYHNGYDGYHNAADRYAGNSGYANRADNLNHAASHNLQDDHGMSSDSWAHADNAFKSSDAFSGFGHGIGGGGGWQSRASSFRGWGSMHSGGFSGGRFGGGHFGGGGFHGFRR